MKVLHVLVAGLVVVGALNWALVGLFRVDLVPAALGDATDLMVGAAAFFQALQWKAVARGA